MRRTLLLFSVLLMGFAPAPMRAPKPGSAAEDAKALQGSWLAEEGIEATFKGDILSFGTRLGPGLSYRVKLDASSKPKAIDMTQTGGNVGRICLGIYALEKDVLKLCFKEQGKGRPRAFATNGNYTLRGQDWHIFKTLELMDEKCFGLLLVFGSHFVQAIINGPLELLEGIKPSGVQGLLADETP